MAGAPQGNTNATTGSEWRQAIKRALARKADKDGNPATYRAGLDAVADDLVKAASNGDRWAIEEIGNRADGKPPQSLTVSGDEDAPLFPRTVNVNVKRPEPRD